MNYKSFFLQILYGDYPALRASARLGDWMVIPHPLPNKKKYLQSTFWAYIFNVISCKLYITVRHHNNQHKISIIAGPIRKHPFGPAEI